jgi:LmbE family N-acetylglucosaminyl deacetylase
MTSQGKPPRVCVVVAHPDDEALWFGAGLLRLQAAGADVVAVSLTNAQNPVRAHEFRRLCEAVNAAPLMLDYPDGGRERFPDYPVELDESIDAGALSCLITHSPLGQERAHPQHVQTWRALSAWAQDRHVPLAFFAEHSLPELAAGRRALAEGPGVRLRRARLSRQWLARRAVQMLGELPRERIAFDNLRQAVRARRRQFGPVRHVIELEVDIEAKSRLFALYPSQMPGLMEYATTHAEREYVYAVDDRAGWRLMEAMTCRSY